MNNSIRLIPSDDYNFDDGLKYEIIDCDAYFDYVLSICFNGNDSFEESLPDKDVLKNLMIKLLKQKKDRAVSSTEDNRLFEILSIAKIEDAIDNFDDFYKSFDFVHFSYYYPISKIKEYIDCNPCLKSKKLLFYTSSDAPFSFYNELKSNFKDETSNIYIKIDDNYELITFNEYEKTVLKLESIADEIKKLNLSVFEKILYTYDLVRDKIYNESKNSISESRDLNSVLFGDKIVCSGYAKIFKALLERVGIPVNLFHLDGINGKPGHLRNEIYVKDEKYNIDGVYYFDSTWDCRKPECEERFPYTYNFFAKTANQMNEYDKKKDLVNNYFCDFSDEYGEAFYNITRIINNPQRDDRYSNEVKAINHMSKTINDSALLMPFFFSSDRLSDILKKSIPSNDVLCNNAIDLIEKYNKPIPGSTYIKALYNVRKVQYYNNPEKFSLNDVDFLKTAIVSGWNFLTPEEKLLEYLFKEEIAVKNQNPKDRERAAVFEIYYNEIPKKVKQVQFTKVLRDIRDNKTR